MMFVMPGIHFEGADDPRLIRFASVIAWGGRAVAVGVLPDYVSLTPTPAVFDHADELVATALGSNFRPGGPALLFSISFGSLPAFHVAASPAGERFSSLVTFGGYGVWEPTARFAVVGGASVARPDPLNRAVVAMNVGRFVPGIAGAIQTLQPAWFRFCQRTWGRPEMKDRAALRQVAEELAEDLPLGLRSVFLMGCGATDDGIDALLQGLVDGEWAYLDALPLVERIRTRLHVFHGVSDDVIPHQQADAIAAACPPGAQVRVYKTGLYSHTGVDGAGAGLTEQIREYYTMGRMLLALAT